MAKVDKQKLLNKIISDIQRNLPLIKDDQAMMFNRDELKIIFAAVSDYKPSISEGEADEDSNGNFG